MLSLTNMVLQISLLRPFQHIIKQNLMVKLILLEYKIACLTIKVNFTISNRVLNKFNAVPLTYDIALVIFTQKWMLKLTLFE